VAASSRRDEPEKELKMKHATILLLVLLTMTIAAVAQKVQTTDANVVAEITSLEHQSVKADLAGGSAFQQTYLADDYTAGSSWGRWDTKQSILRDLESPKENNTKKEAISDLTVRSYGDTAIATFQETYDSSYHGEHRARTILSTDTWSKQNGAWKLVASHSSQIAK